VSLKKNRNAQPGPHYTVDQSPAHFPDVQALAATSMDRDAWQMLAGHLIIAGLEQRARAGREGNAAEATPASRLARLLRLRPQRT
jgi:hypothetical protein